MLRLLILIVFAATLWSVWWAIGSGGSEAATRAWFEARRAQGWAADYGAMSVHGFPSRFDTVFEDVQLADPSTGLAWTAPRFQINALSYKPNHLIAVWPATQHVATPLGSYRIDSDDMRASLVVAPDLDLALKRATLSAQSLAALPNDGSAPIRAAALVLAAEQTESDPTRYRLGLEARDVAPPVTLLRMPGSAGQLPDRLRLLKADLTVRFDKPWNMSAIEQARPQPRHIDLSLADAQWGALQLQLAGTLEIDPGGKPSGEITVKARNWRDMLALGVQSGLIAPDMAAPLENALGLMAQLKGNPQTLDIPLSFRAGQIKLGPVPLGPAPILTIR